jgi:CrcB protein
MIRLYLLVAVGGAIGSVGRFWMAAAVGRLTGPAFPWGTILINILGSFAIGALAGLTAQGRGQGVASLQAFTMAGLCGGFTTFSAFSLQTLELLRVGQPLQAAANAGGSVVVCVLACAAGLALGRL